MTNAEISLEKTVQKLSTVQDWTLWLHRNPLYQGQESGVKEESLMSDYQILHLVMNEHWRDVLKEYAKKYGIE